MDEEERAAGHGAEVSRGIDRPLRSRGRKKPLGRPKREGRSIVETYGLAKLKATADPDSANEMLAANATKLLDVVHAVVNAPYEVLQENQNLLDFVVTRLTSSIAGRLANNSAMIRPVGQALVDHLNSALADNQAILNTVQSSVGLDITSRIPPTSPEVEGAPNLANATIETGLPTYTLFVNATTHQVVAVPGRKADWDKEGWIPPAGWRQWRELSIDLPSVQNYLHTYVAQIVHEASQALSQ
jgi:hypothetical protein